MSEANWIAKTIVPNSSQLNAEDMLTGPITVTVEDVRQGDADQPVAISIKGRQPYKPCKTMRRLLIAVWGGVAVGGIRISHVSHIDNPHTLMLTVTRGKRQAFTVKPLDTKGHESRQPQTVAERVKIAVDCYQNANTSERLLQLDKHIDGLLAEANERQKIDITKARDAAVERCNQSVEA